MAHDLVITGGTVVDGTGANPYHAALFSGRLGAFFSPSVV